MSNAEINEIVKAMAYGFTDEQVAEECGMPVEQAAAFRTEHSAEIAKKAGECNG